MNKNVLISNHPKTIFNQFYTQIEFRKQKA